MLDPAMPGGRGPGRGVPGDGHDKYIGAKTGVAFTWTTPTTQQLAGESHGGEGQAGL